MYVIGTAGHVDHGKSTLVKALTGIDPDRLQEEPKTRNHFRRSWLLALIAVTLLTSQLACENEHAAAEDALDNLVAELEVDRPADVAAYTERLQAFLKAHPEFYGIWARLIDRSGSFIASTYAHRTDGGYAATELDVPHAGHGEPKGFPSLLPANAGDWTDPYYDAGGGETWMVTRWVPARDADGIFAMIATDLLVDAPEP